MTVAVVAGVGPGLGESVARRFAAEGCDVGLLARSADYLGDLAADLPTAAVAAPANLADPEDITAAFERVREELGPVDVLVNNASAASWTGLRDTTLDSFDRAYEVGPRADFLCAQAAVDDMLDPERGAPGGTVIVTGATTSVRGREGAVGFSMAKFGSRGLAESMARELGPEGVHVAHVVIDGGILGPDVETDTPEEYLDPDAVADSYWHLVEQGRSAWTLELDLRPHVESF
ncbi:SDR family NAD(P)-dependent oxidoreductase [Halobaculum lipolyticum]|uniref:SDR family NAD(P)-dependent oxidoreductase n=1 Tax=Halobaculum lipolyticum TaxID=3032001 RepID=A0ABD5WE70_9EURY|nr:SDR family NAD(P)-dependent oxidoreductase [Halobaculum sp. DT31]